MSDFTLDFYGDFDGGEGNMDTDTDGNKLRALADWFDREDARRGLIVAPGRMLVQEDLRRMADRLDALDDPFANAKPVDLKTWTENTVHMTDEEYKRFADAAGFDFD